MDTRNEETRSDDSTFEAMDPEASPGAVPRTGVKRVNKLPLVIIGVIALAFVAVIGASAASKAQKQREAATAAASEQDKPAQQGDTSALAAAVVGDKKEGFVPPAAASAPSLASSGALEAPPVPPRAGASSPVTVARPAAGDPPPPLPPGRVAESRDAAALQRDEQELEAIRRERLKLAGEAIRSKTAAAGAAGALAEISGKSGSRSAGTPASREDMLARLAEVRQQLDQASKGEGAAVQARLQQLQGLVANAAAGGGTAGPAPLSAAAPARSSRNDLAQFAGNGQGDRWRSDAEVEAPASAYELRGGITTFDAYLQRGINSELPGTIYAIVSRNVYDTATGRHLLIPQGTKVHGVYSSEVNFGQSRVLCAWQRLVFPDGKTLDLGAMPAADMAGYSGLSDQVNNHYLRIYGNALLMSGITAGVAMSQRDRSSNSPTASSALSEALGQQLGQVSMQLINKNLAVSPTLEIRPGFPLKVVVVKDLVLRKPYEAFDYVAAEPGN